MNRVRITDAVEVALTTALNPSPPAVPYPVGTVNAPPGITDGAGKVNKPHAIIQPIPSGTISGDLDEPDGMPTLEYQVTYIGLNRKQAEWMADEGRDVMIERTAGGQFMHGITPVGSYVVDRSVALYGGVTSEVPGTYTVVDSYYLVVT